MPALVDLDLISALVLFGAAALVITATGVFITGVADRLADKTNLGEAMVGGIFLGMATSLSGSVVSITAGLDGRASLAFANGIGGIAAQTAFLALADIMFRRANLEHASAELANVLQAALLTLLLSIPVVAATGPDIDILGIHPVSFVLPVIYVFGLRATAKLREEPMWRPVWTVETREDKPQKDNTDDTATRTLLVRFAVLALILGVAGWVISKAAGVIADSTGLSETIVGAMMTAVVTSLPELVTTLAAVRRGALQLAVGGIIGGNTFDVLFLSASDIAYRPGSLYHAVGAEDLFWVGVSLAMTSILLLGLIVRQRQGPGSIGFESTAILAIYVAAVALQL